MGAVAQDIIDGAFLLLWISAPQVKDRSVGLITLNDMLGVWGGDGLLVPYMTTENFSLVVGQISYTIGSGGNFDTVRPLKIANAYIQDSNSNDYPLDVLMSKREYNEIKLKTTTGRPERLFYDPQYSLGKIYFDFTPETAETLYLDSWKSLTEFTDLNTIVDLPDMYKKPLKYNLAVDLAPIYGVKLSPEIINNAERSKAVLGDINFKQVSEMKVDLALRTTFYRGG